MMAVTKPRNESQPPQFAGDFAGSFAGDFDAEDSHVVDVEVLIIGAGPTGAAAAIHAARSGFDSLMVDAAEFPRDKTCGDGLTPRAIHELASLGLAEEITSGYRHRGLKLHGFGASVTAPWPDSAFGAVGSAMPRKKLDQLIVDAALRAGARLWDGASAQAVRLGDRGIEEVSVKRGARMVCVRPKVVLVADGVRSTFGRILGRTWHRGEVYGIAARSYCSSSFHDEPWIHSHLELRDEAGVIQPGYGWIFPLGNGDVNLGCGALSTDQRPAKVNTKKLLQHYAAQQQAKWELGEPRLVTSAMLPMGGAVSQVSGPNWVLLGDAAACVNPLNGEGIDYGMETARLAVELITDSIGDARRWSRLALKESWPALLRERYGKAFLLARTLARALTHPKFLPAAGPLAMRGPLGAKLMPAAARLMGNLVTPEDEDLVARTWRASGLAMSKLRQHSPLWS